MYNTFITVFFGLLFSRYFVLTRDYLHCFKRASGSANERASDMGQFIFKVSARQLQSVDRLDPGWTS